MKSILLIDDDPNILGVFEATLAEQGYVLHTAVNGSEGLDLARRHRPDLIISDILMPGGDGRELLREIRQDPTIGGTQVVLMTGNVDDASMTTEMERGADDFLAKPLTIRRILSCVRSRLHRAEVHAKVEHRMLESLRSTIHTNLPHEFFTPLAGILGVVQLLRGDLRELAWEDIDSLLGEIEQSGWRLHRTLQNYLTIIRLQTEGETPLDPQNFLRALDGETVLRQRLDLAMGRHERQGDCSCTIEAVDLALPLEAFGKIVEELIDNAFRHSSHGTSVTIDLTREGVLRIQDEGRGMTTEQLRHLEAFRQFDREQFEQQGLGLGLAIVQHLLRRCGGTIHFSSRFGEGTTVEVRFPLDDPSTRAGRKADSPTFGDS